MAAQYPSPGSVVAAALALEAPDGSIQLISLSAGIPVSIPAGLATEATLAALSAKLPASLGIKVAAASLSVAPASDAVFILGTGANIAGKFGIDQSTPGTTNGVVARGVDATNVAPSVNPVYVSCLVSSGVPAYSTGRVAPPTLTLAGELIVATGGIGTNAGDGQGVGVNLQVARDGTARIGGTGIWLWDGAAYDRAVVPNANARLLSSAATTNATSVKASAGKAFKISGNNTVASKRYLKLYNKASAPTVGTDTPVVTFVLPASAPFAINLGENGQHFATGIAFAITGAAADADTTAIASGDIECLNLSYA